MKRLFAITFALSLAIGTFAPVVLSTAHAQVSTMATGSTTTDSEVVLAADAKDNIGTCMGGGFTSGITTNIAACVAWITYFIPYTIGEWFMGIAARTFDVAASLTLSSKLYTAGSFLQEGWQITRDFANIFFILILLFIALSLVLDIEIGHANPKKMLASLVMVAIVINFSFFITEVVIDLSNSLALVFYNQVTVVSSVNGKTIDDAQLNKQLQSAQTLDAKGNSVNYIQITKPLSVALVQAMKPQILSDQTFYNKLCRSTEQGFYTSQDTGAGDATKCDNNKMSGIMIALFVLVGIMFIVVGYCFVVALGSLFGRMIGLFINIITAPIAFISLIVPSMNHSFGSLGFDEWFSSLMTNAFAAPIFFFFILIISILSKTSIIPTNTASLSPGVILLLVTIQFLILITMLLKATSYVKKASGEIGAAMGGLAGGLVKTLGGAALGTAAGAVAVAGSSTIGMAGNKIAKNQTFTNWAKSDNIFARMAGKAVIQTGQKASKASFNVAPGLASVTGLPVSGVGMFSEKNTAGGFEGRVSRAAAKDAAFADSLKENESQAKALKDLKDGKDKTVEKLEIQVRLAQQQLETNKALLQEQKDIKSDAKEAMDQMLKRDPSAKNTKAYRDLQDQYDAAETAMTKKTFVTDANGNTKAVTLKTEVEDQRAKVADLKEAVEKTKQGDRDSKTLEQRTVVKGETMANGRKATEEDVKNGVITASDLSLKDLENLIESNKKANGKAYLYRRAEESGAHVKPDYDKMGNVKSFHVDSGEPGTNQWGKSLVRALGKASVGAAIGFAVGGPITAAIAAGWTGLGGQIAEEFANAGFGNKVGSSFMAAERAHHTAEPHDSKHGHDDHGHGAHGGGVLAELKSNFAEAANAIIGGGGSPSKAAKSHH